MPIYKQTGIQPGNPIQLSFVERLRAGRVVPVVSDEALADLVLGGYELFLASYARYVKYPPPLGQPDSLGTVIKYHKHRPREKPLTDQALKFDYLNYVKNHFYRLAKADGMNPAGAGRGRAPACSSTSPVTATPMTAATGCIQQTEGHPMIGTAKPILFLAFANDRDDRTRSLHELTEEAQRL